MIDIELIREKPEFVKESFKRRGKEVPLTEIIDLDQRRRTAISEMDSLRARRNAVSKEIGSSKEKPPELIAEMRQVGARIKDLEGEENEISDRLHHIMLFLPNISSESPDPLKYTPSLASGVYNESFVKPVCLSSMNRSA